LHYLNNNVLVIDQSEYIEDRPVPGPFPAFPMTKRESPGNEVEYCTYAANRCFGHGQNVYIRFNPAFHTTPKVTIGLTLIDAHKDQNVRVRASVTSVTKNGFYLKFKPWYYSITYQIGVNWMACQ
jgi:hypothetical protein